MKRMVLSQDVISAFITQQRQDEKSKATLEKYNRDILAFYSFLPEDKRVDKEKVIDYKTHLIEADYAVASINSMLVAVNSILAYMGAYECRVRLIKQQRQSFCDKKKELTREEYFNLVETAQKRGNMQLALILQTICATGIRVSELQYITVQALRRQEAQVSCKGKIRRILIPKALCNMSYNDLVERVRIESVNSTQVMKITVKDTDPERARAIAADIVEQAPEIIIQTVKAGSVEIISQAKANEIPVSPSKMKNTALAGILGVVLSVGIIVLKFLLNNKFMTDEDITNKLGITVLGIIPQIDMKGER